MKNEDNDEGSDMEVRVPPLCSICGTLVAEEDWLLSEFLTCSSSSCIQDAREARRKSRAEFEKRISGRKARNVARPIKHVRDIERRLASGKTSASQRPWTQ